MSQFFHAPPKLQQVLSATVLMFLSTGACAGTLNAYFQATSAIGAKAGVGSPAATSASQLTLGANFTENVGLEF